MAGIVADTSACIHLERHGASPREAFEALSRHDSSAALVTSAIVYSELRHGIHRAESSQRAFLRRVFFEQIFEVIPVLPFTRETGVIAAKIRGEQAKQGNTLPFADSLIPATAVEPKLQRTNLEHHRVHPHPGPTCHSVHTALKPNHAAAYFIDIPPILLVRPPCRKIKSRHRLSFLFSFRTRHFARFRLAIKRLRGGSRSAHRT